MPTGYTSIIHDGDIHAKDFIMRCARAFGATISMRDESLDTPIPEEFKGTSYYKNNIERLEKRLIEIQNISESEIQKKIDEEYAIELEGIRQSATEKMAMKVRVEGLIEDIKNWDNISEYDELKKFTLSQLKIELDDANMHLDYCKKAMAVKKNTNVPKEWLMDTIKDIKNDLEYNNKNNNKEVERISSNNRWVTGLRTDLCKINQNKRNIL